MATPTARLDQEMVGRGLAASRARAQALIAAGAVRVDGQTATKPAQRVAESAAIDVTDDSGIWVSRGALKLVHALDRFGLAPSGVALDVGASTGGFTQVLLARGAAHVHALDVGRGQLHPDIAGDPRVTEHSGVNVRAIPEELIPPVGWIVADVSFISLEKALPGALSLAKPGAVLVALIKPQFEVGRAGIGKGGVVRDPVLRQAARRRICEWLEERGWQVTGQTESPITGGDGNREFLIAARGPEPG